MTTIPDLMLPCPFTVITSLWEDDGRVLKIWTNGRTGYTVYDIKLVNREWSDFKMSSQVSNNFLMSPLSLLIL